MTSHIASVEDYNKIVSILKGEDICLEENKMKRYRLKKKAECFLIIDDLLYLKDDEGLHKRVLYKGQEMVMKMEVLNLHKQNHYGQNRLFELCKKLFFAIPREIIRKVCSICAKAQPLKTREKFRHILSKITFERLITN